MAHNHHQHNPPPPAPMHPLHHEQPTIQPNLLLHRTAQQRIYQDTYYDGRLDHHHLQHPPPDVFQNAYLPYQQPIPRTPPRNRPTEWSQTPRQLHPGLTLTLPPLRSTPSVASSLPRSIQAASEQRDSLSPDREYDPRKDGEPIYSTAGVDLNSASATRTPNFVFVRPEQHDTPIYVLKCIYPLKTCLVIKQWMIARFVEDETLRAPGIVRVESQELHLCAEATEGHLVLLEDACHLNGNNDLPVSVFALFIRGDDRVRWFYTLLSPSTLLTRLDETNCLATPTSLSEVHPKTQSHTRLFTFLTHSFTSALSIPHHPSYALARTLTDYSPPILSPETAIERLESNKDLYQSHSGISLHLDLADDRYLLHLPSAERWIASDLKLRCAEYMLLKRRFFQAFWKEMVVGKERVGRGRARVRSEHAHLVWLEENAGDVAADGKKANGEPKLEGEGKKDGGKWTVSRAKKLVWAWRILGFLDEKRYLPWLMAGGMMEEVAEMEAEAEWEDGAVRGVARASGRR